MSKKRTVLLLVTLLVPSFSFAVEPGDRILVNADSIQLFSNPRKVGHAVYLPRGSKFQILEMAEGQWLKVRFEGTGNGLIRDIDNYWIQKKGIYFEPEFSAVEINLDVSLKQAGELRAAKRIKDNDYLNRKNKKLSLQPPYYVSAKLDISYRYFESQPLGILAQIWDVSEEFRMVRIDWESRKSSLDLDTDNLDEYINRYREIYGTGVTTPFCSLNSRKTVSTIHLNIESIKSVVEKPGCYPHGHVGWERAKLADSLYTVNGNSFFTEMQMQTGFFFKTDLAGEVQGVDLLYTFEIKFKDGSQESLMRTMRILWPMCI